MNNLKGRKIKGFKFENSNIGFSDEMNNFIGSIGKVDCVYADRVLVEFDFGSYFHYPIDQIEKHLIPEENEIPELGEGVLMEVSDSEDFSKSCKKNVIGRYRGLFIEGSSNYINYWKYARPIKEKVVLTHKQIAEKFDIDINQLEIENEKGTRSVCDNA